MDQNELMGKNATRNVGDTFSTEVDHLEHISDKDRRGFGISCQRCGLLP